MENKKKMKLLIVDDDVTTARSLQLMIRKKYKAIEVETANSGFSAIKRVRQGGINAVLTDVAMEGMDGCDLYRKIKETDVNIQVIMMSAFYDPSHTIIKLKLEGLKDIVPGLEIIEKKDLIELVFKKIEQHFLNNEE